MKRLKDVLDQEYLTRLQPPVSEAFRQQCLDMIGRFPEADGGAPQGRKRLVAIALTAVLLLSLVGVAFAIASRKGVLGFLMPAGDHAAVETFVQTEFTQDGGSIGGVSLRVRDAVSDGRTLFIAVEARTDDPGEALLVTMDEHLHEYGMDGADRIDWDMLESATAIRRVFPLNHVESKVFSSRDGHFIPVIGLNWAYEEGGAVVFTIMVDVQAMSDQADTLLVRIFPHVAERVGRAEYEAAYGGVPGNVQGPFYISLGEAPLATEIKVGKMEIRTAKAQTPFSFGGYAYSRLEVAVSPLCTYVTIRKTALKPRGDFAFDTPCDADGAAYEPLATIMASAYLPNDSGAWDDIPMQTIYRHKGALPAGIQLQTAHTDGASVETLLLPLTEMD